MKTFPKSNNANIIHDHIDDAWHLFYSMMVWFTVDCNDSVELKEIRKELISLNALSVSSTTDILPNAKKLNPQDLQRWNMNSKQDPLRPRLDLDFRFMKSPLRFTSVSHTNEREINAIALF